MSTTYVEAIGRNTNEDKGHSHLYEKKGEDYTPMCMYGWNRSNGVAFSIFRGHRGARGLCKICEKRKAAELPGVPAKANSHKTKWL